MSRAPIENIETGNPEDYEVAWALQTRAEELGWHVFHRMVMPRRIVITIDKDLEPEPGLGKDDPS